VLLIRVRLIRVRRLEDGQRVQPQPGAQVRAELRGAAGVPLPDLGDQRGRGAQRVDPAFRLVQPEPAQPVLGHHLDQRDAQVLQQRYRTLAVPGDQTGRIGPGRKYDGVDRAGPVPGQAVGPVGRSRPGGPVTAMGRGGVSAL